MGKEEVIKKELSEILELLKVDFSVSIEKKDDTYKIQIDSTDDAPLLIGKRGETLSALTSILEAALFKIFQTPTKLEVNVNDYRKKQEDRLYAMAEEAAKEATTLNKPVHLRSLTPFERKIIHEFISENYKDLNSHSEGIGIDRVLIIEPKKS